MLIGDTVYVQQAYDADTKNMAAIVTMIQPDGVTINATVFPDQATHYYLAGLLPQGQSPNPSLPYYVSPRS